MADTSNTFGNHWMLNNDGAELGEYRSYVNKVGNKRYYSSAEAKLFFGGEELEEIVTINWTMQEPKMPLYGYNSFTFDEVAVGSRIIQGTFIINYLVPNYLAKIVRTNAATTSTATDSENTEQLQQQQSDEDKAEDKEVTTGSEKSTANDQAAVGKKTTTAATAHDNKSDSLYSSDSGEGGKIDHHKAHTNLPQNFSIKVRYGSDKEGTVPCITFDEVWLQSMGQTLTENGSPVYEQYSFIARDMGYSAWAR